MYLAEKEMKTTFLLSLGIIVERPASLVTITEVFQNQIKY